MNIYSRHRITGFETFNGSAIVEPRPGNPHGPEVTIYDANEVQIMNFDADGFYTFLSELNMLRSLIADSDPARADRS